MGTHGRPQGRGRELWGGGTRSLHPPSRSGVIGSGLCIFSKFPILDTLLYQYSLNGYPYMVSGVGGHTAPLGPHGAVPDPISPLPFFQLQHGDWFCGKSVGLAVINISGIVFNVYVTHVSTSVWGTRVATWPLLSPPCSNLMRYCLGWGGCVPKAGLCSGVGVLLVGSASSHGS